MYQEGLSRRPAAVLANKMDVEESVEKLAKLAEMVGGELEVIPVSGGLGSTLPACWLG